MKKKEQKSKSKRKVEIKVQFFQYNFIVVGYLYPENKLKFTWAAMLNPHFLSYVQCKKTWNSCNLSTNKSLESSYNILITKNLN